MVYPKWIPGEHGPTGPLNDLAALRISSGGEPLDWRRDENDIYAFHVTVPPNASSIDVVFDVLLNAPGDEMATHSLAILNWNRALLYQAGIDSHQYYVKPSIVLPAGWEYATALRGAQPSGDRIDFGDAAQHARRLAARHGTLRSQVGPVARRLRLCAVRRLRRRPKDLEVSENVVHAYQRLPAEAFAMYGSRHFYDYHALLTLSDTIGFQGIEHHQSADDRAGSDFLTDPVRALASGDLRGSRVFPLLERQVPPSSRSHDAELPGAARTDLLWVYEGMNQYLGDLLSFRCGIRAPSQFPEYIASVYAQMDYETGRATTPLIDLTTGAPYFYLARGVYAAIRRNANDFYTEGDLLLARRRYHSARDRTERTRSTRFSIVSPSRRSPARSFRRTRAIKSRAC